MKTINLKNYDGSVSSYSTKQINLTDDSNNQIPYIDTSDATAVENNLTYGKVGYANGQRVIGTRQDEVDVQGIIAEYQVKSGENINAGDFVEFFNEYLSRPKSCTDAPSAVLLDENKIFIAHQYGTDKYLYGTIVTIDGTTMTPVTTQLSTVSYSCVQAPSAILLEPNKVFIAHSQGSSRYLYGTIVTIDGTTMTPVTTQLSTVSYSCIQAPSAILLEPDKVFIAHSYINNRYLYGTIVTIDGTTMTPVTTQLSTTSSSCYLAPSAILLESNKVFIAHSYSNSYYLYGTIVTIDGDTMTPITTQLNATQFECYYAPSAILLELNKIFIAHTYYSSSSGHLHGTIVNVTGTELTPVTQVLSTNNTSNTAPSAILLEPNKIFIAHAYTVSKYLYGSIVTVSETTMTRATIITISGVDYSNVYAPSAILLALNKIFIAHAYDNTNYYLNGTRVELVDNTPSLFPTALKTYAYPYESQINGIAYSSSSDNLIIQVKVPQ